MKEKILRGLSLLMTMALAFNLSMVPVLAAGSGSGSGSGNSSGGIQPPIIVPSISNAKVITTCPCSPTANNNMSFSYDYSNLSSSSALITLKIYHMLGNIKSIVKTWGPSSLTGPSNGGSGTWNRSWDGSGDTSVPNDTDYYFEVSGTSGNTTLSTITAGPFTIDNTLIVNGNNPPPVVNPVPAISNVKVVDQSQLPFAANLPTPLKFNYSYANLSAGGASIDVKIKRFIPQFNTYTTIKTDFFTGLNAPIGTGNIDYNWDGIDPTTGKAGIDGSYLLEVSGTNIDSNSQTTALGPVSVNFMVQNFQVVQPPVAQGSVSITPLVQTSYAQGQSITLGYDYVSKSEALVVAASIVRESDNATVKTFAGDLINTNLTGSKTLTWDQKDVNNVQAGTGAYKFLVDWHDTDSPVYHLVASFIIDMPTITNAKIVNSGSFYNFSSAPIQFSVDYANFAGATFDARVYLKQGQNETDYANWGGIQFGVAGSGTKTYTWDGLNSNNTPALNGTYYFEVTAYNNGTKMGKLTSAPFTIKNPTITSPTVSFTDYDPKTQGPLKIDFDIADFFNGQKADVMTYIVKSIGQNNQIIYIKTLTGIGNGHYSYTWDGTGNDIGVYGVAISATTSNAYVTNMSLPKGSVGGATAFNIVVGSNVVPVDPNTTTISNLSVTPNPYDPSKGAAILSYTVNNVQNTTMLDATIYDINNNTISQWTGIHPVSGANTITWNASSSLSDGLYLYEVKGAGIAVAKAVFTVNNTVSDLPPGTILCSIFPDNPKVAEDSDDCKAIKYFKEKGVFTGTAQGDLDPYGLLQRDQITKVLLTSFSKYDAAVNYCTGTTLLKDIGQGAWYDNYVCRGSNLQVGGKVMITGYSSGPDAGYFRPDWKVNRAEFAALVFRLFGNAGTTNFSDVKSTDWYADYAKSVKFYNLWTGTFDAQKTLSRLEVIQALYKLHLADSSKI